MTSRFVRIARVAAVIALTSLPAISGAAIMAQSEKWLRYSASVIPPLPTSSMSGSFHWSGPANGHNGSFMSAMSVMPHE